MDNKHSGYNITKKEIHEGLFGFLEKIDNTLLSEEFFKNLKYIELKHKSNPIRKELKKPILDENSINKMSPKERIEMLNRLIDNGLDKLSEDEKKLLPLLAK